MHDISELVARVREHYLQHWVAFVEIQRNEWSNRGANEVIFEVPELDNLFRGLYRVDFALKDDDTLVVRELEPDRILEFDPFTTDVRGTTVTFENLEWRDILLEYDGPQPHQAAVDRWFEYWFDPNGTRSQSETTIGQTIHALFVGAHDLNVDFGTATAEAFWDLLELIAAAGASRIRVTCEKDE